MSGLGRDCVKTQKNSEPSKNGLSKRALRRFLGIGNGNPTHEYFEIWSFHTAWGQSRRSMAPRKPAGCVKLYWCETRTWKASKGVCVKLYLQGQRIETDRLIGELASNFIVRPQPPD